MQVIFDCDPGNGVPGSDIDDGLALGIILRSPEMELLAVTIVGGNTPVALGVASARALLDAAGSKVPIHHGVPRPLLEDPARWRRELDHRADREPVASLWRGLPVVPPADVSARADAAETIVRLVDSNPGEVTVIAVGPLTNVAQAILIDPDLPKKVKRISIMGGAFCVPHRVEELNFGYDPEAARIVCTSGAPITLLPIDVTLTTNLTLADNAKLIGASSKLAQFLGATTEPWIRYIITARSLERDGCALHDPLAVALVLQPSLITSDHVCVDVELHGRVTRGRPVSWRADDKVVARGLDLPKLTPIDLVMSADNAPFVEFMLERLMR